MTIQITEEIQNKVGLYLASDPHTPVSQMSTSLGLTEGEVTFALPEQMVKHVSGEHAQRILETLPSWGQLTTIIHSCASVFEVKAPFPKGKVLHGYYNLMGREGELHGHLRIDLITDIAFVSKPFRGSESHYIGFFDVSGDCMFKVYLGRDKKRQLFPEQINLFEQMKQEFTK